VAWAGEYNHFGLWDMSTGKELHRLKAGDLKAMAVAFSPDGCVVVTVSEHDFVHCPVQLWDASTGEKIADWPHQPVGSPVAFSPDGRLLVALFDEGIALWEMTTRKQVLQFKGLSSAIHALAFSPDGRVLVTAGEDGTLLVWDITGGLRDGRLKALTLTPQELEADWQDLAGEDAARAHRAAWRLVAGAAQALPFIEKRLRPVPFVPSQPVARLIADLDDDEFEVRENASRQLAELGEVAASALRRSLKDTRSEEVRKRASHLLEQLEKPAAQTLLSSRAVAVLEHVGSSEASRILDRFAGGAPQARLTREAKAALERLAKR
jgi:hypothetical protein